MRKRTPVDALDGLTVETILLFPVAASILGTLAVNGTGAFTTATPVRDLLLVGGGPITAVPLTLFAAGARRVRMTTLGFLQYITPSITLLVADIADGRGFHPAPMRSRSVVFGVRCCLSVWKGPSYARAPAIWLKHSPSAAINRFRRHRNVEVCRDRRTGEPLREPLARPASATARRSPRC
ncbi:MAG: hypothetical protein WDM89_17510 [Rhizomicrobium sp.]